MHDIHITVSLGIRRLLRCGDSDLLVQQAMKTWNAEDPPMEAYYAMVR